VSSSGCVGNITRSAVLRSIGLENVGDLYPFSWPASRYYPERTAIAADGAHLTFRRLHDVLEAFAAAFKQTRFSIWGPTRYSPSEWTEYIELVYAALAGSNRSPPEHTAFGGGNRSRSRGRKSAGPGTAFIMQSRNRTVMAPGARQRTGILGMIPSHDPLDPESDFGSPIYQRHNGPAERRYAGRMQTFSRMSTILTTDEIREGAVYLHAAPIFHTRTFPRCLRFGVWRWSDNHSQFSPQIFCETVERERVSHTVWCDNDQFADPISRS